MKNIKLKLLILNTIILLGLSSCVKNENKVNITPAKEANIEENVLSEENNLIIEKELSYEEKFKDSFFKRYEELYPNNKEIQLNEVLLIKSENIDSKQTSDKFSVFLDFNLDSDLNDNIPVIERTSANIAKEFSSLDQDNIIDEISFIWSLNKEFTLGNISFNKDETTITLKEINLNKKYIGKIPMYFLFYFKSVITKSFVY